MTYNKKMLLNGIKIAVQNLENSDDHEFNKRELEILIEYAKLLNEIETDEQECEKVMKRKGKWFIKRCPW